MRTPIHGRRPYRFIIKRSAKNLWSAAALPPPLAKPTPHPLDRVAIPPRAHPSFRFLLGLNRSSHLPAVAVILSAAKNLIHSSVSQPKSSALPNPPTPPVAAGFSRAICPCLGFHCHPDRVPFATRISPRSLSPPSLALWVKAFAVDNPHPQTFIPVLPSPNPAHSQIHPHHL